jgi:hypothetical protein
MWLDGRKLSTGQVNAVLPKDGRAHELRVAAEGYAPTTVLFVDAAPPGQVQLESLPVRPTAALVAEPKAAEPWRRAPAGPRSSGAAGPKRRAVAEPASREAPSSGGLELTPEFPMHAEPMRKRLEPRLEIIELR